MVDYASFQLVKGSIENRLKKEEWLLLGLFCQCSSFQWHMSMRLITNHIALKAVLSCTSEDSNIPVDFRCGSPVETSVNPYMH